MVDTKIWPDYMEWDIDKEAENIYLKSQEKTVSGCVLQLPAEVPDI